MAEAPALSQRRILALWGPLAASWLLMGVELPLFTACVARMADPKVNLAAYSSLVFPIALIIEAPIMMLLAAATALAGDRETWGRVRRFMHKAGACLTALHVAVAFTPLFDWVAGKVFSVPPEVIEPARLGLRIMTPWTWSIAYRRTHQGLLIRFERGRPMMIGTCLRLAANVSVYLAGYALHARGVPLAGIAVGTAAVTSGVVTEALFIGWCTRVLQRERPLPARPEGPPLARLAFLRFYVPLALTQLIGLVTLPMGAAAMARMQDPLDSLATWSGVHGFLFLVRSGGFAFNEVVVSLLGSPAARRELPRFGRRLGALSTLVLIVLALTPLAGVWFGGISGLAPELSAFATSAVLLAIPWPFLQALQSWYQGSLVHARRTRGVTEGMAVFFLVTGVTLYCGVRWSTWPGIRFVVFALVLGSLLQTGWLALRHRAARAPEPAAALAHD